MSCRRAINPPRFWRGFCFDCVRRMARDGSAAAATNAGGAPPQQRAALQAAAEASARAGHVFAEHLHQFAEDFGVDAPTLSTALALVFARLIVDLDHAPSVYEACGFGVATDDTRIDLLGDQIRAAVRDLRAQRDGPVH